MCNKNLNATYNNIFSPIESDSNILASQLPESNLKEKIYKLRKLSGLTQKQFALKCNIGYTSLCKYEIGYPASKDNLTKICIALNIDTSYLI